MAAALFLTLYNIWDNHRAAEVAQSVLIALDIPNSLEHESNSKHLENNSSTPLPYYIMYPQIDMPTTEVDGRLYIGVLTMPSIDIELPILDSCSYDGLKISPCRYSGSAYLNTLVIAAHNYDSHFGRLKKLTSGDEILFTDIDGNTFIYQVVELEILSPEDVEEMTSGNWDLTLFTCTIGGQNRIVVRCLRMPQ